MKRAYSTKYGIYYVGETENMHKWKKFAPYFGNVSLIFTSPPFPLNRKKRYGNYQGQEYIDWLSSFSGLFKDLLAPDGSIVIEVGNSWEPGLPTMSTLAIEALLELKDRAEFHLCQQFIWYNMAKLPGPAQWVNIERIRVKDAFTHIWWMSTTERPKANNRQVLIPYSDAMKKLLRSKRYNPGRRPSDHVIGDTSFFRDNKGAIPPNVLTTSNTNSFSDYSKYCRENDIRPHPARMPIDVADFFIRFLTTPGDIVFDPFAGSNTTGAAAERLKRRWLSIEADGQYAEGSIGWFKKAGVAVHRYIRRKQ